jgi:hypothetical protein
MELKILYVNTQISASTQIIDINTPTHVVLNVIENIYTVYNVTLSGGWRGWWWRWPFGGGGEDGGGRRSGEDEWNS